MTEVGGSPGGLTDQQRARIEANRKRALELREENERLKKAKLELPKCEKCGTDEGIVQSYMDTFEVVVCLQCGRKDEMYQLINKTTAKEEYLLTDDTLNFLKYTTKNNPMKAGWAPMKLYLTKLVHEASMKRWGDQDNLMDEKERRALQKTLREKEKVQDVAQSISSDVNTVAGALSEADPASTSKMLGGFEMEGDKQSGAIFNKMIVGIDETMKESAKEKASSPSPSKGSDEMAGLTSDKSKKKGKITFQTYNQAVMDQQDEKGLRLLAKAESRGGGGKRGAPGGINKVDVPIVAANKKKKGSKGGGPNPLAAMIKSIRGK